MGLSEVDATIDLNLLAENLNALFRVIGQPKCLNLSKIYSLAKWYPFLGSRKKKTVIFQATPISKVR